MNRSRMSEIAWAVAGLLMGITCSLMVVGGLWASKNIIQFLPTPTPTPTEDIDAAALLQKARDVINAGHPEEVKEILFPVVRSIPEVADQCTAYRMLGEAELFQGHSQLAAGYYESLYALESSPENLFLLATTYDDGGDLDHALPLYKRLAKDPQPEADVYQADIEWRIEHITAVLEARNHGATLTPEGP